MHDGQNSKKLIKEWDKKLFIKMLMEIGSLSFSSVSPMKGYSCQNVLLGSTVGKQLKEFPFNNSAVVIHQKKIYITARKKILSFSGNPGVDVNPIGYMAIGLFPNAYQTTVFFSKISHQWG